MRSSSRRPNLSRRSSTAALLVCASTLCLGVTGSSAWADADLKVCAAANELPFSHREETGFENRLARALGDAMSRKVTFVWSDKAAIYAVRDQLDKGLCDVVMGVDTGDERVATTRPYYRTGYVFVQAKSSPLNITNWDSPDVQKVGKIGFVGGTPMETMVRKVGLYEDNFNYMKSLMGFKDRRNQYVRVPPEKMVAEVADGTADLAVHFAPEVARYVKAKPELKITLIPDDNVRSDGEKVPHHFNQSVGVRKDDKELLAAVDLALEKARPKIIEILNEEGIPTVPLPAKSERGASIEPLLGAEFE